MAPIAHGPCDRDAAPVAHRTSGRFHTLDGFAVAQSQSVGYMLLPTGSSRIIIPALNIKPPSFGSSLLLRGGLWSSPRIALTSLRH